MRSAPAAALALLVAVMLAVAGCGGNDTTVSAPGESTASTAAGQEQGGEKSIEGYGSEAAGTDRGAILAAFKGYLNAVVEGDVAAACSHLATRVQESLEQLVAKGRKGIGCEEILPKLLAPTAAAVARQQAQGKVTRIRVEGDQAFVVFKAPGAKRYMMGFVREGGEWKATTVAASVLVPQL